ncbi:PREDICTED: L-type lectin-domain containing receptor kinase VI.2-like isoform X2 [Camelina sativa]|uniref:L-type lectin-domain containing receptor kinase VI.2-like isoform X2 n=2 Tax=Camelina sativa TaxID=90675 RepID=A0ABM0XSV1_CAMSA|nr:PREDICTED: L-type lectin-domain containing receptor kinase VI.2-like isoform X2 [Camelina sativa]
MGTQRSMVSVSSLLKLFVFFSVHVRAQRTTTTTTTTTTEFTFRGFSGNQSEIQMEGAAMIKPNGLLRLTDRKSNVTGTAFYHKPVRLLETSTRSSTNVMVRSFSTSFVFVIIPSSPSNKGFGFTFTLSPTPYRPNAGSAQYLGVLNKENDRDPRNHVFAVEFDTVQGSRDDNTDRIGNDIGLNYNSRTSDIQEPVVYYNNDDPNKKEDFQLESGNPIQALLEYDGPTQTLNVTVYPARLGFKPTKPLISRQVPKLLEIVQQEMYVGFTAATGRDQSSAHYVMGWSFSSGGGGDRPMADVLNLSELPPPPPNTAKKRGFNSQVIVLIVALSAVMLVMLVLLFFFVMYKKRLGQEEMLEDWEIDHPRRLRYRDLYAATDGFKENRIIGTGGFGTVFKGKLPNSDPIAVKKIIPSSMQGVREFVAEIESLGRLRHKNLVNLQGWCKHKSDLLLIYDYIPNGSLDSLLYTVPRRSGAVLSWNVRFQITKGIASGLLYLHEEWQKIVIHRDVKPSNVLIDSSMNPRLGDFGLARLYERGTISSQTTALVGTIGYLAPELSRNGKPSTASDVFAFGVLLLEIVSGRKPTDSGSFFLVDWVMELHASGEILSAIDPRLGSGYDGGEAKLALAVGLLCCHQNPESRPSMRMVLRYLNGDENVPEIEDDWGYSNPSRNEFGSKFVGFVSSSPVASSSSLATRVSSISRISGTG